MGEASTKDVLERAKTRKEEDAEGIEGWKVVEHEDWMDVKKEVDEAAADGQKKRDNVPIETTGNGEVDSDNDQSAKSEGEVKKIVEKFQEEHQGFVCVVGEGGKKVSVGFQVYFMQVMPVVTEAHGEIGPHASTKTIEVPRYSSHGV